MTTLDSMIAEFEKPSGGAAPGGAPPRPPAADLDSMIAAFESPSDPTAMHAQGAPPQDVLKAFVSQGMSEDDAIDQIIKLDKEAGPSGDMMRKRAQYGKEPQKMDDTDFGKADAVDYLMNFVAAPARGIAKTLLASPPKAVAVAIRAIQRAHEVGLPSDLRDDTPIQDTYIYRAGKIVEDFVDERLAAHPDIRGSFWSDTLWEGAGTLAGFVAGGAGASQLGGKIARRLAIGGMGAGQEAGSQLEQAEASGESQSKQELSAFLGFGIGASEVVADRLFGFLDKVGVGEGIKKKLVRGGVQGVIELSQEISQQVASNTVAKNIYDQDRSYWEGVGESGAAGGILGFTAAMVMSAAGVPGARMRLRKDLKTPEGASFWAVQNMDSAEKLAEMADGDKAPSRNDVGQLRTVLTSEQDRKEFAAQIKEVLPEVARQSAIMAQQQEPSQPIESEALRGQETQEEIAPQGQETQAQGVVAGQQEVQRPDEAGVGGQEAPIEAKDFQGEPGKLAPALDTWQSNKDESIQEIKINAMNARDRLAEIAGEKNYAGVIRFGPKAQRLQEAGQLYIDLKGVEADQISKWANLSKENATLLKESQNLPAEVKVLAEQTVQENEKIGQRGKEAGVLRHLLSDDTEVGRSYTMRAWKPRKEGRGRGAGPAKFATTTVRAKRRTYESILEGFSEGRELQVKGFIDAYEAMGQQVVQAIANKDLVKLGQKAGVFSDYQQGDMKKVDDPGFADWKYVHPRSLKIDKNADIEVGDWVRAGDRNNLGKVVEVRDNMADVYFANKAEGTEATVALPLESLKGNRAMPSGQNFFITNDGQVLERRSLYALPELADQLNRQLSKKPSGPILANVEKANALAKSTILFQSLYHHAAFLASYAGAGRGLNPVTGYRKGGEAIHNFTPELRALVRGGLTFGLQQEYNAQILKEKGVVGRRVDKVLSENKALSKAKVFEIKEKLVELRDRNADFLFGKFGANLKVQTALLEYEHMMRKHKAELESGKMTPEQVAQDVATAVNADFGGLHHARLQTGLGLGKKVGRTARNQLIFRLLALAPDWTESNIRMMVGAFKGGMEGELYRAMWTRAVIKLGGATVLFNLLMSAMDDKDFVERYKIAWKEGNFRWMDVDVTPIYRALGGDKSKRKYFSIIRHFRDPIKFIVHPFRSAKHKGSVLTRFAMDAATGTDWADRPFTTWGELVGVDDKGVYKTSRQGKYRKGQKKGGKLAGQLVSRSRATSGSDLTYLQLPSFLLYEARQTLPIPMQGGISFLAGELDAFDWITRSLGMMTATTYPENKESKKKRTH